MNIHNRTEVAEVGTLTHRDRVFVFYVSVRHVIGLEVSCAKQLNHPREFEMPFGMLTLQVGGWGPARGITLV